MVGYLFQSSQKPLSVEVLLRAHSAELMECAIVTYDGKAPLFFVDAGARIDTEIYLEDILRKHFLPWFTSHFEKKMRAVQQDEALVHEANLNISGAGILTDFIAAKDCPPNSPEFIFLNYFI
ncbi:unnamed protein product [Nippostrongylus brasiliensis]|uniref:Uncharacterized protein n=1 Tax=Nippostrongylus brasiliensis TaxID=27835 RepID=A0A0N4XUM4_NIPBR|nr:unnamed protein product [Nippostrongylus brasiliensis]